MVVIADTIITTHGGTMALTITETTGALILITTVTILIIQMAFMEIMVTDTMALAALLL